MGSYNISAGHNPPGKVACGACGLLDESRENRLITKEVIRLLKSYAQKFMTAHVIMAKVNRMF